MVTVLPTGPFNGDIVLIEIVGLCELIFLKIEMNLLPGEEALDIPVTTSGF